MKNCLHHPRLTGNILILFSFLLILFGSIGSVSAMSFDLGPDAKLRMDVQLKYEGAWRVEEPDDDLANEGNLNFDQWDMINNKFGTIIDIELNYKQMGIFVRPRAYYDFVYDDDKFVDDAQDLHRDKAEILDAFAYVEFDLGDHPVTLRAGSQNINWGESLFIPNSISSAQSPVDATAATAPDAELKEIFLPVTQVMGKMDLWCGFSIAGYYQFDWEKTRIPERSSYWSPMDLLDDAGVLAIPGVGVLPQGPKVEPDDEGQFGVALRYMAEALNYTEFGLYYINYHDKAPMLINGIDPIALLPFYFRSYAEDIKLYGFSVSSQIGSWNVSGELSYRTDFPVMVVDASPLALFGFTYDEAEVFQTQVSFIKVWPSSPLWDSITLTGEVGFNKVWEDSDVQLVADDFAWGYTLQFEPEYLQVIGGMDLGIPITYSGNPHGDSSVPNTFTKGSDSLGISLDFTYMTVYEWTIGYSTYFGGAVNNTYDDRDNISVSFKYTF